MIILTFTFLCFGSLTFLTTIPSLWFSSSTFQYNTIYFTALAPFPPLAIDNIRIYLKCGFCIQVKFELNCLHENILNWKYYNEWQLKILPLQTSRLHGSSTGGHGLPPKVAFVIIRRFFVNGRSPFVRHSGHVLSHSHSQGTFQV